MSAARVFGVTTKKRRIGLGRPAVLQEQQSLFADRHGTNEHLGLVECRAQALRNVAGAIKLSGENPGSLATAAQMTAPSGTCRS